MKRDQPLIELAQCSLVLDDNSVLDDVDFALRPGERWALVGPNGSGKSMLLKMLRGDMWPMPTGRERRTYRLDGRLRREPAGIKELIAYIGPERQDKYVRYGWNLTVLEVVTTGLFDEDIPLSRPTRGQRAKVERVLRRFGLWDLRSRRILTLSYGQRRLALVARAFASNARVLLLDEVFNGLDARVRQQLRKALETPRGGHEWVLTSHRPRELPETVTHLARLESGRIVSAAAVRRASGRPHPNPPPHAGESRKGAPRPNPPPHAGEGREGAAVRAGNGSEGASSPLVRIAKADVYRDYRPVLRNLNWTIDEGQHWAVLGANGSGKSTLLSMIYGDLHPALGGKIERRGVPFGTRIERWKRRVGWVSPELQADHYATSSIEEIVISGRYASVGLNAPPTPADRRAADRWLRHFALDALRHRKPRRVSYGQLRLALIARAMVNDPELLLLDEPCTGLDADVREQVLCAIEHLADNGTQIIMAVHDPDDIIAPIHHILTIGPAGRVTTRQRRR